MVGHGVNLEDLPHGAVFITAGYNLVTGLNTFDTVSATENATNVTFNYGRKVNMAPSNMVDDWGGSWVLSTNGTTVSLRVTNSHVYTKYNGGALISSEVKECTGTK